MHSIPSPLSGVRSPWGGRRAFTLAALFSNGEQGKTFEPWDMTTLYQDRAGTTPVTAVGQVVGYRRDKSGRGNHDVAISDAARGVYGREPKNGTRNLLVPIPTEDFSNASWLRTGISPFGSGSVANSAAAPDGTMSADFICEDTTTGSHYVRCTGTAIGQSATFSAYVKSAGRTYAYLYSSANTFSGLDCRVNLSTGVVTNNAVGTTVTTEDFGGGWWRVKMAMTGVYSGAVGFFAVVGPASGAGAGIPSYLGDGVSGILVWGAQVEVGSPATTYQKVASAYDVTEAGVASCYYVQTDGVNDAYVTPTITPGTDKAQIFMGLKKLNDTTSILMELSASAGPNAGTFYALTGPDTGPLGSVNGYSSLSRGSAAATALQTAQIVQAAPDYAVIVATHDIAGDLSTIERNGVAGTSGTADKGTGNFLAYPVYVYARGGTTLPAAVRDYGHAFRFGPNLSASAIAQARTLIAANTPTVTL